MIEFIFEFIFLFITQILILTLISIFYFVMLLQAHIGLPKQLISSYAKGEFYQARYQSQKIYYTHLFVFQLNSVHHKQR